jgi:hypothetical protein
MRRNLLLLLFLCNGSLAYSQGDFTSAKEQQIIAKRHIKQITCYYFANAAKTADSILVDSMGFYKTGLLLKQTNNYRYNNEYGTDSRLVKQTLVTLGGSDSEVVVFEYDLKGNMILRETVRKFQHTESEYPDFTRHRFEYGPKNELLREYWVNSKTQSVQMHRYKYLYTGLDADMKKQVNFYDGKDQLIFTKKYYKNDVVKDYSVDNGKITYAAESVLNSNGDLLRFTDHYHMNEDDMLLVQKMGHGMIRHETITEIYKYDRFGFCTEKITYKNNKPVCYYKWYFK